eukprot:6183786-Pleurochrysis_carterae.AAC.3
MADSACSRPGLKATAQARPAPAPALHSPAHPGQSLQLGSRKNQNRRYTPNEGVRADPERAVKCADVY